VAKMEEKLKQMEKRLVAKMEEKLEQMETRLEDRMCEEMRERAVRRLNLVLHYRYVEEPSQRIRDGRERMKADKKACVKIFTAAKITATSEEITFCRRIGEKRDEPRPLLLGLKSEDAKSPILEKARDLQKTDYKDVTIGNVEAETGGGEENEGRGGQKEQGGTLPRRCGKKLKSG
jgi:hypothetical protein